MAGSPDTDTSHHAVLPGVDQERAEAAGRRLLGLDAGWCTATGLSLALLARPASRALGTGPGVVVAAGLSAAAAGLGLGVASVARDWQAVARPVVVGNAVLSAGLLGVAASRGTPAARVGCLLAAGQAAGFAVLQARALVAAQGPVVA